MNQSDTHHELPIVLAITGASGAVYATRLLEVLLCQQIPVHLTLSSSAASVIQQELNVTTALDGSNIVDVMEASDRFLQIDSKSLHNARATQKAIDSGLLRTHHFKDYFTPIASGSSLTRGMVICPCSGSTLSAVAHAASNNLIQRAADVHLKERRKLVVVPRETPINTFQLENMTRLSREGVVVLPASPGWYHGVESMIDLVDFVVARILDQFGIANKQMRRWAEDLPPQDNAGES